MKKQEKARLQPTQKSETWSMRGIEPETRTAVTIAARKAGQTVGEWCNRALRDAATERLKERVPGPTMEETLAKLAESMARQTEAAQQQNAAIVARLEAMEQREPESGRNGGGNLLGRLYGLFWRKNGWGG